MIKPRLTDLQSVLLSAALRKETGSLIPVPVGSTDKATAVNKALGLLLKRGLVAETEQPPAGTEWRSDGDLRFGLALTESGRAALGVTTTHDSAEIVVPLASQTPLALPERASAQSTRAIPAPTKTAAVIGLLGRKQGATLAELVQATGWLPHTTRAALTGLRKKGHALTKGKRGDATCYTIVKANA